MGWSSLHTNAYNTVMFTNYMMSYLLLLSRNLTFMIVNATGRFHLVVCFAAPLHTAIRRLLRAAAARCSSSAPPRATACHRTLLHSAACKLCSAARKPRAAACYPAPTRVALLRV